MKPSSWISTTNSRVAHIKCGCGKIRQAKIPAWIDDKLAAQWMKILGSSCCKRCELEYNRDTNTCPEVCYLANRGVSACVLSYGHTGTCEPWKP